MSVNCWTEWFFLYISGFNMHMHSRELIDVFWFNTKLTAIFRHRARSFKLSMITNFLWVYQFIPYLMTLTVFQGHKCFFSLVYWCRLMGSGAVYITNIMHSIFCIFFVRCVCKGNGTHFVLVLHLHVSCLSVTVHLHK